MIAETDDRCVPYTKDGAIENPMTNPSAVLLACVDEAYDRKSWHGTTLRGSLRGLGAADAAWRPGRGRHSIWDIVVHCAYWKYAVRRLLTDVKRGSFALTGSNWFPQPARPTAAAWRDAVALLGAEHQALRDTIREVPPDRLDERPSRSTFTRAALIRGIAAHDLYHAGQIQLIKRLKASRAR
jgi:hypothetical protein